MGARKQHPLFRELVHIWSDRLSTQATNPIVQVIDGKEQYIALRRGGLYRNQR